MSKYCNFFTKRARFYMIFKNLENHLEKLGKCKQVADITPYHK